MMARGTFRAFPGLHAARMGAMRPDPGIPVQAETTGLLAAMTVQPNAMRQQLINSMIFSLKDAGLWATFDFFLVFAAHDAQASRVGWINPARVASVNGTPVFTVDRGWRGDGIAAWLGLGTNWSALTKYTQNDCCLGAWIQSDTSEPSPIIGQPTLTRVALTPRNTLGNLVFRLNAGAGAGGPVPSSRGHSVGVRRSSAGYDMYKDGQLLTNSASVSVTLSAEDVVFLRHQAQYSGSHILAAAHGGSSLNDAGVTTLASILNTYMTGVGA